MASIPTVGHKSMLGRRREGLLIQVNSEMNGISQA